MLKSVLIIIGLAVRKLKGTIVSFLICVAFYDLIQFFRYRNPILLEDYQLLCPAFGVVSLSCSFKVNRATNDLNRLTLRT